MSLTVQNLTCRRGFRTVFEGLSFTAKAGDIIALTGANGSGKTSLLRILAGLLEPGAGTVERPGACCWIGTDDPLKPDLTARENLEFWAYGETGPDALSAFDLEKLTDTPVRYLSRGQQRRVTLSGLFSANAILWLLDEPETGLDTENIGRLTARVRVHAARGGIAVIGTHRPEVWEGARILTLSPPGGGRGEGAACAEPLEQAVPSPQPSPRGGEGAWGRVFRRDMRIYRRRTGRALTAPLFFILAVSLFPLGLSPDSALLEGTAAGMLGMAALFAALLTADRMFDDDRRDGTLDALVAAESPLAPYAMERLAAGWLASALPLVAVSPLLGLILGLDWRACLFIPLVLTPATMLLLLFGALGAALVSGARQGTVLLALLVLPLYSPVLIFASGAIELQRTGGQAVTPLLLLWAMLAIALPAVPVACGAIARGLVKN